MKVIRALEDQLELGEFSSQGMFFLVKLYEQWDGKRAPKRTRKNCSETNAGSAPTVLWQLHH